MMSFTGTRANISAKSQAEKGFVYTFPAHVELLRGQLQADKSTIVSAMLGHDQKMSFAAHKKGASGSFPL